MPAPITPPRVFSYVEKKDKIRMLVKQNLKVIVEQYKSPLCVCVLCNVTVDDSATQTLNHFLESCHLSHLEDVLLANGFDQLDFMVVSFHL